MTEFSSSQAHHANAQAFEQWAGILKALAHPSRLLIVEELARGEQCVRDLTDLVGHDMSTVSKHLSLLREAGIVEDEKRGKQVYCRLRLPCVLEILYAVRSVTAAQVSRAARPSRAVRG